MTHILSFIFLIGVSLSQGCLSQQDDAKASQPEPGNRALQHELEVVRAEAREVGNKARSLEQQLTDTQRDFNGEKMRGTGLQAENDRLQTENLRLAKMVSRLDPTSKPAKLWTRAELERALLGQTKDEIKKVLGPPVTSYGSAATLLKYGRVSFNPATGKVDEFVQLNFDGNALKSIVY